MASGVRHTSPAGASCSITSSMPFSPLAPPVVGKINILPAFYPGEELFGQKKRAPAALLREKGVKIEPYEQFGLIWLVFAQI